ncbi:tRNA lysidine(34) synthetase TilS [Phenylobacterium sp.]|uniref:tRNA lysidine(34) synthetase TilS n=1 Tax=Phenylobacterium sp. TaxID=1871053 RepID=UPI002C878705|nr:tRNA lysidine(34) synthetase TilS [Phenylobacterium sp.]HVI32247.1 tRNA lysidine(34) synthetase TilS [Phenylobacterium sp.]
MRGLDVGPADSLADRVRQILDRRLLRDADAPVAVALSGGGDSLALALIAADWANGAGRRLLILNVDHRLQPQSAAWAHACARIAERLGADFRALAWTGPKPASGLSAAARAARHRLLADAARQAGARVILMGHTASDLAEAAAMRAEGSTVPDAREWAPSPAWPEGRGVFLLRPLLGASREELRHWLLERGETWIEDPANSGTASARARVRAAGAAAPEAGAPPPDPGALATLGESCRFDPGGGLRLPRQALRDVAPAAAQAFLGVAAVCVGGGDRRPATDRLRRVREILAGPAALATTLAGARIEADDAEVSVLREPGEARRGGLPTLYLTPGRPLVWDGRFEFTAAQPGLHVDRLEGVSRRLPPQQQDALRLLPPKARLGLPVVVEGDRIVCPALTGVEGIEMRPLVPDRLFAACGLVEREPV